MQWSGERRTAERGPPLLGMNEFDVEILLKPGLLFRANEPKIPARLMIASHEKMLAIINHITRLVIDEGVRPSAEMRFSLEEEDPGA